MSTNPQTKAEREAAEAAFQERLRTRGIAVGPSEYAHGVLPPAEWHTIEAQPAAWKSVPAPVRFAIWLWALAVILGFVGGAIMVLLTLAGIGWAINS